MDMDATDCSSPQPLDIRRPASSSQRAPVAVPPSSACRPVAALYGRTAIFLIHARRAARSARPAHPAGIAVETAGPRRELGRGVARRTPVSCCPALIAAPPRSLPTVTSLPVGHPQAGQECEGRWRATPAIPTAAPSRFAPCPCRGLTDCRPARCGSRLPCVRLTSRRPHVRRLQSPPIPQIVLQVLDLHHRICQYVAHRVFCAVKTRRGRFVPSPARLCPQD